MRKLFTAISLFSFLTLPAAAQEGWEDPGITIVPGARSGYSMVNLNGEIHVFGGQANEVVLDDLWKLREDEAKYEQMEAGIAPPPRYHHSAVVFNGRMYILFGNDADNTYLNDVWQYNSSSVAWSEKTSETPCGVRAGQAAVTAIGTVWITGGENEQGTLKDVWTYNPGLNVWEKKPDMPHPLSGHAAVGYKNTIYVYGCQNLMKFDAGTNEWSELHPLTMPSWRTHHIATIMEEGTMRVFGGQEANGVALSDVWEYRFDDNTWTRVGDMPVPLTQSAAAMLYTSTVKLSRQQLSTRMVLFGGITKDGTLSDATYLFAPSGTLVDSESKIMTDFALLQNYPNPFNPETSITYRVKEPCRVKLTIFDPCGREVVTLVDAEIQAGSYTVRFDASGLASGLYFYQIRMKDFMGVKKMVVVQ